MGKILITKPSKHHTWPCNCLYKWEILTGMYSYLWHWRKLTKIRFSWFYGNFQYFPIHFLREIRKMYFPNMILHPFFMVMTYYPILSENNTIWTINKVFWKTILLLKFETKITVVSWILSYAKLAKSNEAISRKWPKTPILETNRRIFWRHIFFWKSGFVTFVHSLESSLMQKI